METRARSHTRESLNKPDEPPNRTRRLLEMSRLLVLFDVLGETLAFVCVGRGPELTSPTSARYAKVLTLNHPSRLALNTKQLAGNPHFTPLRGTSAAPAWLSPGYGQRREDAGSPLPAARKPRAPQSPLPAKSSLCAAAGSRLAARGQGASTQGGDQRPWLSGHLLHLVKIKKKISLL